MWEYVNLTMELSSNMTAKSATFQILYIILSEIFLGEDVLKYNLDIEVCGFNANIFRSN